MNLFETTIIDNLLGKDEQDSIHDTIMNRCQWQFLNDVSGVSNQSYPSHGFVHILKHPDPFISNSQFYGEISVPILNALSKRLNIKENYYNRIFLQLPLASQYKKERNGIHVDLPAEIKHIACVYYCNGSDGETTVYDQTISEVPGNSTNINLTVHKKVMPERGKIVLFDGSRYHCSSQPTINYRCVINFDLILEQ